MPSRSAARIGSAKVELETLGNSEDQGEGQVIVGAL